MALEKSRDVTIGGINFRIGLVSALVGDWIITQLLTKRFTEETVYASVQSHLLTACSIYIEKDGNRIPMRMFGSGRWLMAGAFPDLEYDADTLHSLIDQAMDLNFTPFFEKLKSRSGAEIPAILQ